MNFEEEPVRKGTGLGLSICKKFAEFVGGTNELESEIGKGTLFRVRLLAKIAEAADVRTPGDDKPRGIGFREQRQEILAAGCNDMVPKPFLACEIFEAMARFLVIEYIYETESEAVPDRLDRTDLTSTMLADLPDELLQELRQATLALNREAALEVIARIPRCGSALRIFPCWFGLLLEF